MSDLRATAEAFQPLQIDTFHSDDIHEPDNISLQ